MTGRAGSRFQGFLYHTAVATESYGLASLKRGSTPLLQEEGSLEGSLRREGAERRVGLVLDVVHESSQGCRHSAGVGRAATTSTHVAMLGGSGSASVWAWGREGVLSAQAAQRLLPIEMNGVSQSSHLFHGCHPRSL